MAIERFAGQIAPLLDIPYVRRTRRNHGLEHATIHLLSARVSNLRMAGRSDDHGFVLIGEAKTEQIESAVSDALKRMQKGEHDLAVHPNCGTNLVTTAMMVSVAALFGTLGASRRRLFDRLPAVFALVTIALFFAPGVGTELQRTITTEGDPGDLEIVSIKRSEMQFPFAEGRTVIHRVTTRGG